MHWQKIEMIMNASIQGQIPCVSNPLFIWEKLLSNSETSIKEKRVSDISHETSFVVAGGRENADSLPSQDRT